MKRFERSGRWERRRFGRTLEWKRKELGKEKIWDMPERLKLFALRREQRLERLLERRRTYINELKAMLKAYPTLSESVRRSKRFGLKESYSSLRQSLRSSKFLRSTIGISESRSRRYRKMTRTKDCGCGQKVVPTFEEFLRHRGKSHLLKYIK